VDWRFAPPFDAVEQGMAQRMAWESRRSGRKFYYRYSRRKGRLCKRYVGSASNQAVEVIALADRLERAERKAAAAASRSEREEYEEANTLVIALFSGSELLTTAGLARAGFYRKQRGPWKLKKRRTRMSHEESHQAPSSDPTQDEFRQLVFKAEAGDVEAVAQLARTLDQFPAIWLQVADLAAQAEAALIRLISSKSALLSQSLERKVRRMKFDLQGPSSSSLEKGIVERIVASWLQTQFAEIASVEHASDQEANAWQKRLDQTQRRYLSAVTSLATVRKLLAQDPK
jgi:hypothetical protein